MHISRRKEEATITWVGGMETQHSQDPYFWVGDPQTVG